MADLRIATTEEKFQLTVNMKELDGTTAYDLTSCTNAYMRNISTDPVTEQVMTITTPATGVCNIIPASGFFQVGENKITFRLDFSGSDNYSNEEYSIEGFTA